MPTPEKSKEFQKFFTESYNLFRKTASYTTYLEKLDLNYVNIGAINELRGVLYHLYGYLDEDQAGPEFLAANYIEAKEHLVRAYLDLFSAICTVLSEKISNYEKIYSSEILSEIIPFYYTEIIPQLYILFEDIARVRGSRKIENTPFSDLEENHIIIMKLNRWYGSLVSSTQRLEKKKSEINKKKNKDLFFKFLIPLLMLIVGYVISVFFPADKFRNQHEGNQGNQHKPVAKSSSLKNT